MTSLFPIAFFFFGEGVLALACGGGAGFSCEGFKVGFAFPFVLSGAGSGTG
jgi:hypothetical protein